MEINRRALYNSLRMNWVLNPTLEVEAWQVEDYRSMSIDVIFEKLEDHGIHLDKFSFISFADTVDNPEDLTEALFDESEEDPKTSDFIYLLIFELWRRLLPEKPSLSIFCDEIDHQIHVYDQDTAENTEEIQDALANLQLILDENIDEGANPKEAFEIFDAGCANDIESFLYDFIVQQIDNNNEPYASELLEGFSKYVRDVKWFDFLRARLLANNDQKEANKIVKQLIKDMRKHPDLEFTFEVLSFLVVFGDRETFEGLAKTAADLLEVEDDFQTLVSISADFYHRLDHESIEQALQGILNKRTKIDPDKPFDRKDEQISELFKIISC